MRPKELAVVIPTLEDPNSEVEARESIAGEAWTPIVAPPVIPFNLATLATPTVALVGTRSTASSIFARSLITIASLRLWLTSSRGRRLSLTLDLLLITIARLRSIILLTTHRTLTNTERCDEHERYNDSGDLFISLHDRPPRLWEGTSITIPRF
jgi:hypothetical protein